jgi:hypothetical protein
MTSPVIPEKATKQKPENGESRGQPRPDPSSAKPLGAKTARLVISMGVRHHSILN